MAGLIRRVFAALGLPPEHREAVAEWIDGNDVPGTRAPAENLHVTIRWFGDLEEVSFERLAAGLDEADLGGPFTMRLTEVGAFPRASKATVAWLRPEADGLDDLRAVVDDAARGAGIDDEDRPFRPHLTVARIRPELDLRAWMARVPPVSIGVPVDRLSILRSHLGGGPARYELLEQFEL